MPKNDKRDDIIGTLTKNREPAEWCKDAITEKLAELEKQFGEWWAELSPEERRAAADQRKLLEQFACAWRAQFPPAKA